MTPTPQNPCCRTCLSKNGMLPTTFLACPICGNKRCPRATDHKFECTGSNESGQPGSVYGALATCSTCNAEAPCMNVTKPGGETEWICKDCWTRKRENERRDYPPAGVFGIVKNQQADPKLIQGHPATWWQHFKQDCMPGWFVQMFPIVFTPTKTIDEWPRK